VEQATPDKEDSSAKSQKQEPFTHFKIEVSERLLAIKIFISVP
jgi:hypothetical protein